MAKSSQRHAIKRQILDLKIGSNIKLFELQNQLSALYRNKIVPLIDNYCNQIADPDHIIRIESLDIDLGEIKLETLETDFVQKVADALHELLTQKQTSVSTPTTPVAPHISSPMPRQSNSHASLSQTRLVQANQNHTNLIDADLELFQTFLQTGQLPWWSEPLNQKSLEERFNRFLSHSPERLRVLMQQALKQNKIRQRILYQFSEQMLIDLVKLLAPTIHSSILAYLGDILVLIPSIKSWSSIAPSQLNQTLWQEILLQLVFNPTSVTDIDTVLSSNLLHIANRFRISWQSLIQQLLIALEAQTKTGITFASSLPKLLTKLAPTRLSQTATLETTSQIEMIEDIESMPSLLTDNHISLGLNLDSPLDNKAIYIQNAGLTLETASQIEMIEDIESMPSLLTDNHISLGLNIGSPFTDNKAIYIQNAGLTLETASQIEMIEDIESMPSLLTDNHISLGLNIGSPFTDNKVIYIQNAGLTLLWPFLTRFFETLGLVQSGQFLSPQATHRAVLCLQYLVDTSLESLEPILPLNKLLCGMNLSDSLPIHLDITEDEQTECDYLLSAVIQHWSALKSTTPQGFRQAFLQRDGILRMDNGNWRLQVEQETYDILLDQLPWGISVIKLPWMDEFLSVDW